MLCVSFFGGGNLLGLTGGWGWGERGGGDGELLVLPGKGGECRVERGEGSRGEVGGLGDGEMRR